MKITCRECKDFFWNLRARAKNLGGEEGEEEEEEEEEKKRRRRRG